MNLLEAVLYLALNLYHEARSEEQLDQIAVAHVVLNRARIRGLTVKEVVLQPYQFSWTIEQKSYVPTEILAFAKCMANVKVAIEGRDFTNGATHYHADYVIPEWTNRMEYLGTYGTHHFYKDR